MEVQPNLLVEARKKPKKCSSAECREMSLG